MKSDAASKDLQRVHSVVALNFHIDPDRVANMYQDVGLQFKDRIIDPGMQEAIKASTAKFTAEELITKRELVRDEIKAQLKARLKERNILVDEFNIVNFEFSKNFNDAIEAKVTAEQQALAAKNKLEQIKFEADQKIAEARGKAEAMTIESNALKSNPPDPGAACSRKMERNSAAGDWGRYTIYQPAKVATILGAHLSLDSIGGVGP